MASRTRLSMAGKQFFIVGDSVAREPELARFFSTYCGGTRVQVLDTDPSAFVAELHERWRARNPQTGASPGPAAVAAARVGIFLSYAREDAQPRRLSRRSRPGGDVWQTSGSIRRPLGGGS
jgi:hypothetical protein